MRIKKSTKINKKGTIDEFLSFFIVGIAALAIMAVIFIVVQNNVKEKSDIVKTDMNIHKGLYTTRTILSQEISPGYKVYDLVIETTATGDYEKFTAEMTKAIYNFYPEGKTSEEWLLIINDECFLVSQAGQKDSATTSYAPGGIAPAQLIVTDQCDEDEYAQLPKVTVPNPYGDNIIVLFKIANNVDAMKGRVYGYRAAALQGYTPENENTGVGAGSYESLKNIPKVTCTTRVGTGKNPPTSDQDCDRECIASPELVQALKLAAAGLAENEEIRISQSYRTIETQRCLFEVYCNKDNNNKCNTGERPVCNPDDKLCAHTIAGAIDINFYRNGRCLSCSSSSSTEVLEVEKYMCKYGFVRWSGEPWHYEYGTNQWTIAMQKRNGGQEPCAY
ncbi:MAG: hypothetical protein ACP5N3_01285 [Candidatus Nanoarchaeia archaeon]